MSSSNVRVGAERYKDEKGRWRLRRTVYNKGVDYRRSGRHFGEREIERHRRQREKREARREDV